MWLKYGVALDGNLTSIDEVVRGKTQLTCLYCGGSLTAKKGSVKEPTFRRCGWDSFISCEIWEPKRFWVEVMRF